MNKSASGWIHGFVGVLIFSGSLPATRAAVLAFDPVFLTVARAAIAGLIAAGLLWASKSRRPGRGDLVALALVSVCVVVGFPLLSALALRRISSAHSLVFIGLLPLSTALFAVLRGGEQPRPAFWIYSCLGSAMVAAYAVEQDSSSSAFADALMLAAIVVCGLGYAEGARLARRLGGWQVICWALVMSLPAMLIIALALTPPAWDHIATRAWIGLGYVSLFSMLIGFVFWYRGLALGGIAAVGQLQLLQPFIGLALAAVVLHEQVSGVMLLATGAVILCVSAARRFA